MAAAGDGEEPAAEYESDPEEALRPFRRRAASDDEEDEGEEGYDGAARTERRVSDGESDGEGGNEEEEEEEFDEEEEEELEEEEVERVSEGGGDVGGGAAAVRESGGDGELEAAGGNQGGGEAEVEEEEQKKEKELSAVPTAGAFYMHDDRFKETGRGRHRHVPGARNLWESKDERAWVHDRFEEMNIQDSRYDERRKPRGRFRGRGNSKSGGDDRGYTGGNRSRTSDDSNNYNNRPRSYDDTNNQNHAPRSVKGRGPRRYEPLTKNYREFPASQHKKYMESHESISSTGSRTQSSLSSYVQPNPILPRKHVFASSLSSSSPPFYPSVSSSKGSSTQKRATRTGSNNKTVSSPMQTGDNFSSVQSGSLPREKSSVDSVGHNRRYTDDSNRPVAGKSSSQLQSAGTSLSSTSLTQPHSRFQGRSLNSTAPINHQPTPQLNQITQASSQTQIPLIQQKQAQTPVQAVMQQMSQRHSGGIQAPSQPQAPSANPYEVGEMRSPPVTGKSNSPLVGKGTINNQGGNGNVSFLYSGASQVLGGSGAMSLAHSDQNFPGTPALLPVMQFGGQHHGGAGVPAFGMALPGFVANAQLGFNSEMTWMPVLASGAGALGQQYCSPYMALDSSFYSRTSEQGHASSSTSSSREIVTKPANTSTSPQEPEIVNDESGQRQNKPRRYSEMNFGL